MHVEKIGQTLGDSVHEAVKTSAKETAEEAKGMDQFEQYLLQAIEETESIRESIDLDMDACETLRSLLYKQRHKVALDTEIAVLQDVLMQYQALNQPGQDDLTGLARREAGNGE